MTPSSPTQGPAASVARAAAAVLPALQAAAARTGVDFAALFHTARLESGFDPAARAPTSSATGLFQFTNATWLETLARHGARHGLAPAGRAQALAMRTDPLASSLMAAEHMADNARALADGLGRAPSGVDLYLAHFLGAGGALRFLGALARAPEDPAAPMFPAAAGANRSIFFAAGAPRSLQQVHDLFARKLGAEAAAPAPLPTIAEATPSEATPAEAEAAGRVARLAYLLLADMGA